MGLCGGLWSSHAIAPQTYGGNGGRKQHADKVYQVTVFIAAMAAAHAYKGENIKDQITAVGEYQG